MFLKVPVVEIFLAGSCMMNVSCLELRLKWKKETKEKSSTAKMSKGNLRGRGMVQICKKSRRKLCKLSAIHF